TIMLVDSLFLGIFTLIRMFQLNWMLTIISLVTITITIVFAQFFEKRITKATDANFAAYERLSDFVQEDLSGISVVKAFTKEKLQVRRFQKYNQDNVDTCLNMVKESARFDAIIMSVIDTLFILTIVYSAVLIYRHSIGEDIAFTIGDLTKFLAYFDTLIWPIDSFGRLFQIRGKGKASLGRITKILENEVEVNDNLVTEKTKDIKELKGLIEYKGLTFNYPGVSEACLKNVNFTINPGEFVGIIGATGSGKTTIVDLLLRVYNVEEGKVFIDGHDIMQLPLATVRDNIAYVPQDNFLFSDTVANNIAFSENEEVDNDKVEATAKLADVYKDVAAFNDKLNTVMGERGVTVSGGQKQRISIARALYKDGNILVLDDSLSAVDTETEKAIIHNLRENRKGKTTIIIAHRISTLQHLDKILVVEDGTVTGIGTHEELLLTNKAYANEARLQELEAEVGEKRER
ncbi:MAG: ABC transporter ATP-binding protein, partial [Bacilli bacterium]|nr:ABC transporter ATP-binding protein [Bacilli bacterium]